MTAGLRSGDKLVHFEVEEQLASGGMGIVWRGYDRLLGRHVAIKQIAERSSVDEMFRDRFRREAEVHKRLSQAHPNIVNTIEFIDDPRGLFIVMEYVDGLSLDRALAQLGGPVESLRALVVMRDVAQALQAIHAAGIVHRDLKPGNILLPAGGGSAKVGDFGLATLMADQDALSVGTAQYMAPELFGGGRVDGRADIYSLGMVAYEMLAGRQAFEGAFKAILRDQRNQAMRWMKWHTNTRISAPPLHEINPQVPQVLSELIERMMAKDPTQRIESAEQLLEAMKRHFSKDGGGVERAPRRKKPRSRRSTAVGAAAGGQVAGGEGPATAPLPKRGPMLYILAALVAVQAAGVGGYFWWQNQQREVAVEAVRDEAMQRFAEARQLFDSGQYEQATPLFAALADEWGGDGRLGIGSRGYQLLGQAKMFLDRGSAEMIDNNYEASVETHRKALVAAQAASDLPLPDEATHLRAALDGLIRREIPARQSFVKEAAQIDAAIRKGDFDAARYLYKKVRDIDASGAGVLTAAEQNELNELHVRIEDQQIRSQIAELDARAARLINEGQYVEARMELNRAIDRVGPDPRLTKRLADLNKRVDLEVAMREATGAEAAGDMARAVAAYTRAHEIEPRPELDAKIKQIRSELAFAEGQRLEAAGSMAAAAGKYQEALSFAPSPQAEARLREMKMADEKGSILASAETAFAAGEFDRAISLYKKALELSPDPNTQSRINEAMVRLHVQKAEAHLQAGNLDAGRAELSNALAINPEDATAAQMMATLQTRARFLQLVAEADKLRADSQFGAAKGTYQKAIDLARTAGFDAKEIQERKFDTEFDHLIAQARSAMDLSLWVQARALLMTARNMRPDDQRVSTLLAEVEANAPKQPR